MTAEAPRRAAQIAQLRTAGFVVIPGFLEPGAVTRLRETASEQLTAASAPLEFEVDLQYPGAPRSRDDAGGETVRRLLDAYARDPLFAAVATSEHVRRWMEDYFGQNVMLSRAHHNCVMTKHPLHGSLTGWHRDMRYWSFERDDLISAWFALGEERVDNGAVWFVPGSHGMQFATDRYDTAQFFRADRDDNAALIETAISPALQAGDAVFFHCNTLHGAGRNLGSGIKFSLVFTYHGSSNTPQPGTRSASVAEIALANAK